MDGRNEKKLTIVVNSVTALFCENMHTPAYWMMLYKYACGGILFSIQTNAAPICVHYYYTYI